MARSGSQEAMGTLFKRHHRAGVSFARSLRGCDPEDAVASAFEGVLRQIRNGAGPRRGFSAYLRRAIENAHVSEVRRTGRVVPTEDEAVLERGGGQDAPSESAQVVAIAFEAMPERQRVALWMTLVDGYTLAEVSQRLDTTEAAAGSLVYRARKRLRSDAMRAMVEDYMELPSAG